MNGWMHRESYGIVQGTFARPHSTVKASQTARQRRREPLQDGVGTGPPLRDTLCSTRDRPECAPDVVARRLLCCSHCPPVSRRSLACCPCSRLCSPAGHCRACDHTQRTQLPCSSQCSCEMCVSQATLVSPMTDDLHMRGPSRLAGRASQDPFDTVETFTKLLLGIR